MPADRARRLPWLVVSEHGDTWLNTPWPARPGKLTEAEAAAVETVRGHLAGGPKQSDCCWINPETGAITPVAASYDWIRARLKMYLTVRA